MEPLEELRQALNAYEADRVEEAVKECIEQGIDPVKTSEVLTATIREIGEKYGRFEIFLAELLMAAEAMKTGMAILQPHLARTKGGTPSLGTFIIGTVKGDIHDVGKNIVSALLAAARFNVVDLGVDVRPSVFVESVKKYKPKIVGASALMSTTMLELKDLIEYFEVVGIRDSVKVMVGGGSVTKEFAQEIGADGYAPDGMGAVEVAKRLVGES